jgi:hypothetical protein
MISRPKQGHAPVTAGKERDKVKQPKSNSGIAEPGVLICEGALRRQRAHASPRLAERFAFSAK